MNLLENIHSVWNLLGRNKIRSFLTMLGIIIGISSVIIIISVGAGAQSLILNQIKSQGSNLITILPGNSDPKGPPASVIGVEITTLKLENIKKIMNGSFSALIAATGYVKGTDTVTWESEKTDTTFTGVNADLVIVEDTGVATGRFFTEEENNAMAKVAVLGSDVAKNLFAGDNPVGRQIKIKKTMFNIIGVMKVRGNSGFQSQDNQIYVPIITAQKLLLGIDHISNARFKVDTAENVNPAMEYISQIMRQEHNIDNPENDDFSVRSMEQSLSMISTITNVLRFFLAAVASIALVVGGVGIMNVMLAAVQERTREIGLRKAVGAKNKYIISQFLVETSMITFIGGVIGIIMGILVSFLVSVIAKKLGYSWDFVVSIWSIVMACVVSIGIGLIFGIVPAKRASKLDPIEALRYE